MMTKMKRSKRVVRKRNQKKKKKSRKRKMKKLKSPKMNKIKKLSEEKIESRTLFLKLNPKYKYHFPVVNILFDISSFYVT